MDRKCSPQNPCKKCGKPDGCMYASDGTALLCSRVEEGSVKLVGQPFAGGWLHILKPGVFKPQSVKKKRLIPINWGLLNQCYIHTFIFVPGGKISRAISPPPFQASIPTLHKIEVGWDGEGYTFPVRNDNDQIIGISRRFPDGSKGMVKGSAIGILIPRIDWHNLKTDICPLFICEGISDTATSLDMGLCAIGRLSCQTGKEHIIKFCIKKKPSRIVIVSDNDLAGIKGAKTLGLNISQGYKLFTAPQPDIKIITPPTGVKDLREWRKNGLDLEELMVYVEGNLDIHP